MIRPNPIFAKRFLYAGRVLRWDREKPGDVGPCPAGEQPDLPLTQLAQLLDAGVDGSGSILYPSAQFRGVRITVDTGQAARSYEGRTLVDVFRKWRTELRVLEIR